MIWVIFMRRLLMLMLDLGLVCLASFFSLLLRENFEVSASQFFDFIPYLIATLASAAVIFPAAGLDRLIWRYCARPDHLRVAGTCGAVVVCAVSLTFAYNRLDGLARSLPILQLIACLFFLVGARVSHKMAHDNRRRKKASPGFLHLVDSEPRTTALIVGISKLTEAYLQAIAALAPERIAIAGLIGQADRYAGRLVADHPVLGAPTDIERILDRLEVHGVTIDRIVIASPSHALTALDRESLAKASRSRGIALQSLADAFGLDGTSATALPAGGREKPEQARPSALSFEILPEELRLIARRRYWHVKRAIDCFGALALLILSLPLMAVAAVLVAASAGFPIFFWQERPGLGGRPFRLYKFRTMKAAHGADGRRLSDAERVSRIGTLMRRLRLDELPQLFNILRGDMCFIGPRPLLPCDQPDAYRARLLVRPGLTGWAQVVGGRTISPADKAALDVWYVRNASLALDLEIAARTIPVVLRGERISRPLIERAWRDLSDGGILRGALVQKY